MTNRREIAYTLLRVTVGVMLLFFGVGKLMMGVDTYRAGLVEQFSNTVLPAALVSAFGLVLPFVETLLGLMLILGFATAAASIGGQVLLVALLFGTVLLPEPPTVANNMLYAAVLFGLTWLVEYNRYSLDEALGLRRQSRLAGTPADPFRERRPHWGERVTRER